MKAHSSSAQAGAAHHGLAHQLVHHFFVALVVASATLLFKHYGLLGFLEAAFLRIVNQAQAASALERSDASRDLPAVLLITDEVYESAFGQEGALDRTQLARELRRLALDAAAPPAVLVLDLDLSPGPPGARSQAGQPQLDQVLAQIAGRGATRLVLMAPLPVATNALVDIKARWMQSLCALPGAAGQPALQFASAQALVTQGMALRYAPELPSLGVVAAKARIDAALDPCALVQRGKEAAQFLRRQAGEPDAGGQDQRPLNARGLLLPDAAVRSIAAASAGLAGRTVFIGAGYGDVDTVATPFGRRNGVEVHAAVYYSVKHPVGQAREWLAFLAEVAFGMALGFLFHASWDRSRASAAALAQAGSRAAFWRGYARSRGWLLGNFALLGLVIVASVSASVAVYRWNLWVDPGPIVLGVFLKSLLASRGAAPAGGGPFEGLAPRVDAAILLPLILWALVLVVTHGH